MSGIDYSTDLLKHYVRRHGWLPACEAQATQLEQHRRKVPLRYFTFCAAEAIDVFMLERAGVIRRGANGRLNGVYFCEADDLAFGTIEALIGSPQQGFRGDFQKIVLFEDDANTAGRNLYGDEDAYYPERVRKKLLLKDAHIRLNDAAPFDIINLDVYGAMFAPRNPIPPPLLEAIQQILHWQTHNPLTKDKTLSTFTLFITAHIDADATKDEAKQQMVNIIRDNLVHQALFSTAFQERYGQCSAEELLARDFPQFYTVSLHKLIIRYAVLDLGWDVAVGPVFLFQRDVTGTSRRQPYTILHSIARFRRIPHFKQHLDSGGTAEYSRAVARLMNEKIVWVNDLVTNPAVARELQEDLAGIIAFRDGVDPTKR